MPLYQPSSSASAITIKDEGSALSTAASSIDFVGAGVTASGTTADKTITIPGGSNQRASISAASAAIANTETVVVSTSVAANYLTAGMSFRIRAAGVGTTGATAGADTFRIRLGTTTLTGNIVTSVAPTANDSVTAQAFGFEAIITCRTTGATGSIIGECQALGDNATTGLFTTLNDLSATTATVAVDTTVANLLELTFQSGSAGSSCTFHTATIEVLASGGTGTTASAGALVLLQSQTASASASLDFSSTISSTYDEYVFEIVNLVGATANQPLNMQMGTGGGPTYDTGANYGYSISAVGVGGAFAVGASSGATAIRILHDVNNTANFPAVGTVRLFDPASAIYKAVTTHGHLRASDANLYGNMGGGLYLSTTAVTAVRFLFGSGNITSGIIRSYGVAKS